jgi:MATE family multidrug resistance protein
MADASQERPALACGSSRGGSPAPTCAQSEWDKAGGYREVLRIAIPLILSTASVTLALFVDRLFLSWYGQSSVAAATPGGITYFTICSLFLGTSQYVNTIVAQHHGLNQKSACARAVWQGIWFSLLSAPLIFLMIPVGSAILAMSGHPSDLIGLESQYFSILMLGGFALPLNAALSSFFSGRGRTGTVLWGNLMGNAANVVLDYLFIFGRWGFPEMGIQGAAIATVLTVFIPSLFWAALFLASRANAAYRTRTEWRFDRRLFFMLLKFGLPSGIQFFLDVASFTVFILLIGRLGEVELAATNIVLSIEMLSYMPMVGMSIATATLVGEYVGRHALRVAETSVKSALKLALAYAGTLAVLYLLFPHLFLDLFKYGSDDASAFGAVLEKGSMLLPIVAVFTIFDTVFVVYSGALKGAGDTTFAMWAQISGAWVLFVPPVYVVVLYTNWGLLGAWCCGLIYIGVMGLVFSLRFHSGNWKDIRMAERP